MNCANCSVEVPHSAKFCPACGAAQSSSEPSRGSGPSEKLSSFISRASGASHIDSADKPASNDTPPVGLPNAGRDGLGRLDGIGESTVSTRTAGGLPKEAASGLGSSTNQPGAVSLPDRLPLADVPEASEFDARSMENLPGRPEGEEVSVELRAAIDLSINQDPGAEDALRQCVADAATPFARAAARMELGTWLNDSLDEDGRQEAAALLVSSLHEPYKGVCANASWNLHNLLAINSHSEKADGYGRLSVRLGNEIAAVNIAEAILQQAPAELEFQQQYEIGKVLEVVHPWSAHRSRLMDAVSDHVLPQYSPDIQEWFNASRRSLPVDPVALQTWDPHFSAFSNTATVFNVEANEASIATEYFGDCDDQCFFEEIPRDCPACDRKPSNFLHCMSGDGDGYYWVFDLTAKESDDTDRIVGSMTVFSPMVSDLSKARLEIPGFGFLAHDALRNGMADFLPAALYDTAPIVLGDLESRGELLFSDSSKLIDGRDITIVRDVDPGTYTVIAWVGINWSHRRLRPYALMAVQPDVAEALTRGVPPLSTEQRDAIINGTYGSGKEIVASHMSQGAYIPNLEQNSRNASLFGRPDEGPSYLMQGAEFVDGGLHDALRSRTDLGTDEEQRALLHRRGIFNPKFPWRSNSREK